MRTIFLLIYYHTYKTYYTIKLIFQKVPIGYIIGKPRCDAVPCIRFCIFLLYLIMM